MKKQIALHNRNVEYTLKVSKRARRMRLTIYDDGSVVVTAPSFMRESYIEQFILQKSQWVLGKLSRVRIVRTRGLALSAPSFQEGKEQTRAFVHDRLQVLNQPYCFDYKRVSIRNQRTRWGSCSKKGNLNFNYRIASLPPHLADYIIVHELCHLREFNHSQTFWDLVARTMPNHRHLRRELRGIPLRGFLVGG